MEEGKKKRDFCGIKSMWFQFVGFYDYDTDKDSTMNLLRIDKKLISFSVAQEMALKSL
jgi:hypothetical protein